mmetsp:Transcript_7535/g.17076  ORF Transcript_7535/g.17076 Transcript_7535/m.17076 type:complete len:269 (+) Transcript_7535:364-1170(+)
MRNHRVHARLVSDEQRMRPIRQRRSKDLQKFRVHESAFGQGVGVHSLHAKVDGHAFSCAATRAPSKRERHTRCMLVEHGTRQVACNDNVVAVYEHDVTASSPTQLLEKKEPLSLDAIVHGPDFSRLLEGVSLHLHISHLLRYGSKVRLHVRKHDESALLVVESCRAQRAYKVVVLCMRDISHVERCNHHLLVRRVFVFERTCRCRIAPVAIREPVDFFRALLQCVVDRTFDGNQRSVLRSRRLWSERLADFPIDIVAAIARGHQVEAH